MEKHWAPLGGSRSCLIGQLEVPHIKASHSNKRWSKASKLCDSVPCILCELLGCWGAAHTSSSASGSWTFSAVLTLLLFLWVFGCFLGTRQQHCPHPQSRSPAGDVAEPSRSSELPLPAFSCNLSWAWKHFRWWEVQTQLCQGSAATERVHVQGGGVVLLLCFGRQADGVIKMIKAPNLVCQEPIDFSRRVTNFLCMHQYQVWSNLLYRGKRNQLSVWFREGCVASRRISTWSFLSDVTCCLNN